MLNSRRGIPWWGAALLAFGLALIGAFADQVVTDSLSVVFHVCYALGAVGAVLAVQRKSLFGPMVQPPLAMALTVPLVVLTASGLPEGSDMLSKALAIGTPLINSFPMMAGTTAATVLVGALRMVKQRAPGRSTDAGNAKPGNTEAGRSSSSGTRREKDAKDTAKAASAKPGKDETQKAVPGPAAAPSDEASAEDDRTRPVMDPARPTARDGARPGRRTPGAPKPQDKPSAPPPERSARPRGGPAAPPPRRQRQDTGQPRAPRDDVPPPRRRPAPPPDQLDKRRGEGRPQPPAGRGRRVPPPPRGDEPPRSEQPPRGRQSGGGPHRDTPRSEPPGGRRGGRPRGDNPPPRRPWEEDRP
ncbi:DUF6542 domain-containing protein [Saccharomonospora xinjiangensis]|uniref:DUF6542 domain-containing protein n=1 Tax=Saccharomonospora xinjiangensis TaxID=75294 RepID=UPI0031ECA4E2